MKGEKVFLMDDSWLSFNCKVKLGLIGFKNEN